jgi:hypothetical protein
MRRSREALRVARGLISLQSNGTRNRAREGERCYLGMERRTAFHRNRGAHAMTCKSLVAIALLAGSAPAFAAQQIAPVQVTATPEFTLEFACDSPVAPSRADVEQLLQINDSRQTHQLSSRLMTAVGQACNAGIARIEVRRGLQGQSLSWTPIRRNVNQGVAARPQLDRGVAAN